METVYKKVNSIGNGNLVLGILVMVFGIALGVVMIVSGSKLKRVKKNIIF